MLRSLRRIISKPPEFMRPNFHSNREGYGLYTKNFQENLDSQISIREACSSNRTGSYK